MRTTRRSRLYESSQDENTHPNTAQKSKGVLSTKTKGLSSNSNISPASSGKWSEDETYKLMELFDEYQNNELSKSSIWDMIAKEVRRSPRACRDKIRNLRLGESFFFKMILIKTCSICACLPISNIGYGNITISYYLFTAGEIKSFKNKAETSQASVEVASSTTDAPEENNIQALEKAIASAELDTSSSDASSSDDWSEEESQKLMKALASIDQGIFDEIPHPTHEIWKKVASKMDKRSPIACHRQMSKLKFIQNVTV